MNTKLYLTCASILSAGVLVGCGEGSSGAPTPASLKVEYSTPANKATRAAIDQPITITFADALDPFTVTQSNIMLMPGNSSMPDMTNMDMDNMDHSQMGTGMADMSVISGKAECDYTANPTACKTIKFTPTMSLAYGQQYHIMVNGLKTANGKIFSGVNAVPLEFTTAFVVETESENNLDQQFTNPARYRKSNFIYSGYNPITGAPLRTQRTDTDGSGTTQVTMYNQQLGIRTGVDVRYRKGLPTTLENIERYSFALKDSAGRTQANIVFDGPGSDITWGTADDTIKSFSIRGENHGGAHHLTTIYSTENNQPSVISPNPLSVTALKLNPGFTRVRGSLMFYDTTNGIRRMLKEIRFSSFGANKIVDIDMNGNKMATSDDTVDQYRVYIYDTIHTTSRVGRKEFDLPEGSTGTLSLNEQLDEASQFLTGYRVYRTASTAAFGLAQGMLRVAEVTYRTAGIDGQWYNTAQNSFLEDDNIIRDIQLNFYCPSNGFSGLYEKYSIEVGLNNSTMIGNYNNITQFLNAYESQLASANNCIAGKPSQSSLAAYGLTNGVLQDISTNELR